MRTLVPLIFVITQRGLLRRFIGRQLLSQFAEVRCGYAKALLCGGLLVTLFLLRCDQSVRQRVFRRQEAAKSA